MKLDIGNLIRFLLLSLIIVGSIQLVGLVVPGFNYLDELLLVFLALILLTKLSYVSISRTKLKLLMLLISLVLLSSIVNYYALEPILIKSTYYLKSALTIFIVSTLSKFYANQRFLDRAMGWITILCLFSFAEFLAIQFLYFSGGVKYSLFNLFLKSRGGIYRASSLTGHPINLGLMGFITIVYYFERLHTRRWIFLFILLGGIIVSGTRMPLLLTLVYVFIKLKNSPVPFINPLRLKHIYALSIPILLVSLLLFVPKYLQEKREITATRGISIAKGIDLLNNPVYATLGTSIGSYGMYESIRYGSPIYSEIDFPDHYKEILSTANRSTGMESFLFMMIFELGILGSALYFLMLIPFRIKVSAFNMLLPLTFILVTLVYPLYTIPFLFILSLILPHYWSY